MVQLIDWRRYLIVSLILLALNSIPGLNSFTRLIFGASWLIWHALFLGNWLLLKNSTSAKLAWGILFILALVALSNTAGFYLWQINAFTHFTTLLLISLGLLILVKKHPLVLEFPEKIKTVISPRILILTISYLILIAGIFFLLFNSRSSESLRSPWQILPPAVFFLYFLASLILFQLLLFGKSKNLLSLICCHFFLAFSVALLVYSLGFNYDTFIHRTNVKLILENGTLLPKPFYYIGQYSVIIFLHRLLSVPIDWLDKLLVPLLSAIYLPLTIFYALKDNFKVEKPILYWTILALLALPFTNFIVTTPQALANFFLLLTILLGPYWLYQSKLAFWPMAILALTALAIHPLAGLPAVFFTALFWLWQQKIKEKIIWPKIIHHSLFWEIAALAAISLPLAFLINSQTLSQLKVNLNQNWLTAFIELLKNLDWSFYFRRFISLTDLIYTYQKNFFFLLTALIIGGLVYLVKNRQFKKILIYPIMAGILIANFILLSIGLSFNSLLSYEQQNYPLRILEISLYFLLPLIVFALYQLFKKILSQQKIFVFLATVILSLGLTNGWYLAYPRLDKVSESHGFSTSQTDVKTVNFLENLNQGQPYIVLASQPVSAAAIQELGFKYYYHDLFFYPVPTGQRLYQLYEDLAFHYEKTADVIATARYLTGVKIIYFVMNNYWLNAHDIIAEHQQTADHWYSLDDKNFIFEYVN